jgi:hypothetical protein
MGYPFFSGLPPLSCSWLLVGCSWVELLISRLVTGVRPPLWGSRMESPRTLGFGAAVWGHGASAGQVRHMGMKGKSGSGWPARHARRVTEFPSPTTTTAKVASQGERT